MVRHSFQADSSSSATERSIVQELGNFSAPLDITGRETVRSDEQLMMEFQEGSKDAFTELFKRYRDPIYGFFRRRLQEAARAEELAQETFLALLRAAARYQPKALFRTYLYSIAMN